MYRPLAPCDACRRHVLASSPSCPFCGAERAPSLEPAAPTVRVSRSAALALAAATMLAGCHTETVPTVAPDPAATGKPASPKPVESIQPPPGPGLVDDQGAAVAEYGAPVPPPSAPPAPRPSGTAHKPLTPPKTIYGGPPPPAPKP
jgi:hypothetical protein